MVLSMLMLSVLSVLSSEVGSERATTSPVPEMTVRLVVASPPAGVDDAERDAARTVDEFWRREFTPLFGKPYAGPRVLGAYAGTEGPTCGGRPSIPDNAFYCDSQDFIAWDQALMTTGFTQVGNAWVYLVVAHEWGHAIQARINRYLVSVAAELQADCLAGATLAGAQRDGLIALQPGDDQRLGRTLTALADRYPWTNRQSHGDAVQRTGSFNLGWQHGVTACLAR